MDDSDRPRRVVVADTSDADGTMWRAITLTDDGCLLITGHDLGPCRRTALHELEKFVSDHDIAGEFWSRIGD